MIVKKKIVNAVLLNVLKQIYLFLLSKYFKHKLKMHI